MIKLSYLGHAAFFMELQHNPFSGPYNILEKFSEFKKCVIVKSKSNGPELYNQMRGHVLV